MRKIFLIALGIVVLSAMGLYPQFDTFAGGPKVRSSKEKKSGKCRTHNNFETSDIVYARGMNFTPSTVDIYVIPNRKWTTGDKFGPLWVGEGAPQDVSTDGVNTDVVVEDGEIPCTTTIWDGSSDPLNPLTVGRYDIVVDDGDGVYDPADGDIIDGKSNNAGFRVREHDSGDDRPKVRSSKEKKPGKCKPHNNFETSDIVYVRGKNFTSSTVDIYVFENRKWTLGDKFGPDWPVDDDVPQDVRTDGGEPTEVAIVGGEIDCTTIVWDGSSDPLKPGRYDIVVDVDQNGEFDPAAGDAVDHKSNMHGFKVR